MEIVPYLALQWTVFTLIIDLTTNCDAKLLCRWKGKVWVCTCVGGISAHVSKNKSSTECLELINQELALFRHRPRWRSS